jgi:hypothetical protein
MPICQARLLVYCAVLSAGETFIRQQAASAKVWLREIRKLRCRPGHVVTAWARWIENRCTDAHLSSMMYIVHHMKLHLRFKGPLLNRG